ncbi:uncharacterized protein Dwil_GK27493 [Drosophila willistoni]|uniref:Uncharacterized protein n=1 Tax=Drosophila willistoni TaxID=7260 RepID=A0A0Q9WQ98_DROWI|nr:uncharacterized protein Dwil_GK27493 [Drosophila willistoni]
MPTTASTLASRTTEETTLETETTFGTSLPIETTSPSSLTEQTTVSHTMPTSGVPLEGSTYPSTARIPTAASTLAPRTTEETTLGTETTFGTNNRFSYHANKRSCFRSNYFPIDCQNSYCSINSCTKNY